MPRLSLGLGVSSSSKLPAGRATPTYANGLYGKRYVGYFADNVGWFNTATLHGDINQLTQIGNFTSNDDYYSWQWLGYFKPSSTENYTFYTSSDDASYVWIGANALAGFTTANANVNNGGLHGPDEVASSPISLTAGVYYPIRIQFGENEEGDEISFSFSTPTIPKTTQGLGYYYYNSNTNGFSAPTFPDVASSSTVNALINTSDATTTSYLQSVGFTAVGGVFSVPLTKQVPPSQIYMSVEYKTTFSDGASCYLIHSTAASNRWYFIMEKFAYYDEEFGNQYDTHIAISTDAGQSNATIPAARSSYLGTNINSMVSPDCFS